MLRDELVELHYITPICNLGSILERGLLSHQRVRHIQHETVAMQEIQDIRAAKRVPGGRPLHEYVNLYICARNPMMFKRHVQHQALCVLQVSPRVLDLPGVAIADQNASSSYVRFAPAPDGLAFVDRELVFAEDWRHADEREYWRRKSAKCAEVLVPEVVPSGFIVGAYVSCSEGRTQIERQAPDLPTTLNAHMFFI